MNGPYVSALIISPSFSYFFQTVCNDIRQMYGSKKGMLHDVYTKSPMRLKGIKSNHIFICAEGNSLIVHNTKKAV